MRLTWALPCVNLMFGRYDVITPCLGLKFPILVFATLAIYRFTLTDCVWIASLFQVVLRSVHLARHLQYSRNTPLGETPPRFESPVWKWFSAMQRWTMCHLFEQNFVWKRRKEVIHVRPVSKSTRKLIGGIWRPETQRLHYVKQQWGFFDGWEEFLKEASLNRGTLFLL